MSYESSTRTYWANIECSLRQGRSSRGAVHSGALYRSPTTAVFAWQETGGRSQSWRGLDDGLLPRSYRGPGTLQVSREDRSDQDKKSKQGTPTREDTASVTRKPRPRQEEQARNSNAIGPVKMIRPGQRTNQEARHVRLDQAATFTRNSSAIGPVKVIRPGQGRTRGSDMCG